MFKERCGCVCVVCVFVRASNKCASALFSISIYNLSKPIYKTTATPLLHQLRLRLHHADPNMADQRRKISRYVLKRYGCPQAPGAIETHALWVGTTTIGRGRETDISLGTEIASRRHCQIDISDDQSTVTVTDNKV